MDIKNILNKAKAVFGKYKYVCVILLAGIALLLLPNKKESKNIAVPLPESSTQKIDEEVLTEVLKSIAGAGDVKVMLSVAFGEKTIYQTDQDISGTSENTNNKTDTVIITDSQRNEQGLINQINPPVYLGAIIVCQGGDVPSVKLAVTQAVSKLTGLGADSICVLKMK